MKGVFSLMKIFKNKFFIVFSLLILSFLLFNSESFCESTGTTITFSDGNNYSIPNMIDLKGDYFIFRFESNEFNIISFDKSICVPVVYNPHDSYHTIDFIVYDKNGYPNTLNASTCDNYLVSSSGEWTSRKFSSGSVRTDLPYFSTCDIFLADSFKTPASDKVFFQGPPKGEELTLMNPMQVEEIPSLITQVIMIILPITLTIFGTLLVVFLIKSKNLLHL